MVANTRAARSGRRPGLAAGKLRPLNQPMPVKVETGEHGEPLAVWPSNRRCTIETLLETWHIDDEWWRRQAVSRVYWRVLLEDGRTMDVYCDLARKSWFKQAYAG